MNRFIGTNLNFFSSIELIVLRGTVLALAIATTFMVATNSLADNKRGMAGAQDQRENAMNVSWAYNWGNTPNHDVDAANFEFVPMIWAGSAGGVSNQVNTILNLETSHGIDVEYVLGFNEPEREDQADMTVEQALNTWEVMTDLFDGTGVKLVSPAVSGGGAVNSWLRPFMNEVENRNTDADPANDLQVDEIALHWYSTGSNPVTQANNILTAIDSLHNDYGRPIWLTEFAGVDFSGNASTENRVQFNEDFLDYIIPRLESRAHVARYSWWQFGIGGKPYSQLQTLSGGVYTPTGIGDRYQGTLQSGDTYDFADGETAPTNVHYLKGGSLTNTGPALGTALRAVDAIEGDSSIGGNANYGFEEADDAFVRVRSGATLRKQGSNKVSLKGAWVDNDGSLRVESGSLSLQNGTEVKGVGSLHVAFGGTLDFGMGSDLAASTVEQPVEFAGGDVRLNTIGSGGSHLISGGTVLQSTASFDGDGSLVISGQIFGSGGIEKGGSGTLFLKQNNTQTGVTNIDSGALVVANSVGSATGTGAILVQAAGTLAGNGAISGEVFSNGKVAPGVSRSSYGTTSVPMFEPGIVVNAIDFDFTGIQDDAPLTQTSTLSSALQLVSGLDFGSGLSPRNSVNQGNEFNVAGFTTGTTWGAAGTANDYLTFTVAPVDGLSMELQDVSFELRRNGTGAATHYRIFTSIDGFDAFNAGLNPLTFQLDENDTSKQTFTAAYTGNEGVTEPLEVRIYGWNANSGSGNTRFTNVSLDASFVSDPNAVAFDPTGILELGGNYTQLDFATLEIDLGGTSAGDYDQLQVAGDVSLAGILDVSLFDGFEGAVGQTFDIITGDSITGMFDSVLTSEGLNFEVIYSDSVVSLELLANLPGDFDNDGDVDMDDVDLLSANLGELASVNLAMDLNNDGTITLADHDQHIMTLLTDANGTGALIGDLNVDGDVDVSQIQIVNGQVINNGDASNLLANLGQASGQLYADGDLNGDGDVDISQIVIVNGQVINLGDASRLLANLGQTTGSASPASAAVPEPGSSAVLSILGIAVAIGRRKRALKFV